MDIKRKGRDAVLLMITGADSDNLVAPGVEAVSYQHNEVIKSGSGG